MPDHFHLLLSPQIALECAMQLIKGGFSFRAKKELGSNAEVWQRGFSDHRIRDFEDYQQHVQYIHRNPVKKHLCEQPSEYRYSSAYPGWKLDPIPQGLKPGDFFAASGTAEAVPFQSTPCRDNMPEPGNLYGADPVHAENHVPGQADAENHDLPAVLKGHDFTHAKKTSVVHGALAPEEAKH